MKKIPGRVDRKLLFHAAASLLMFGVSGAFLSSCGPAGGGNPSARVTSQISQEWALYKANSPFVPFKMWALSLPRDGTGSPSCISDRIFAELEGKIANASRINASVSDPVIHRHIGETVEFWTEIQREQPALKRRVDSLYRSVEDSATGARDSVYDHSSGSVVERGHLAGIGGLVATFGPALRVDEAFHPHVARYAPEALRLARRERELDRRYRFGGDPNHLIDKNIGELERTVAGIRR